MLGAHPDGQFVQQAKTRVLTLLDTPVSLPGDAAGQLARSLSPRHPAWLAPLGWQKTVVEADAQSLELRREAIAHGPLKLAVIANDTAAQRRSAAGP